MKRKDTRNRSLPYPMRVDDTKPFLDMTRSELQEAFDKIGMTNAWHLLEEARRGEQEEAVPVLALLTFTEDGERRQRVALSNLEYGGGEGTRLIDEFIGSVTRIGMLLPGESLRRVVLHGLRWEKLIEIATCVENEVEDKGE